jgi:hypothetical protein
MAGLIIGSYGYQRSGKSLISFMLAENYYKKGLPVYTNVDVKGYNKISSLDDLPFNFEPKVLWLDEINMFLDSRDWADNKESSIFFNTIGKQNILLLITCPMPDMLEKRIRNQHNYVFLVKSDNSFIYYRLIDNQRRQQRDFIIEKGPKLYNQIRYDSNLVPDFVDVDLKRFIEKVREWNLKVSHMETRKVGKYL